MSEAASSEARRGGDGWLRELRDEAESVLPRHVWDYIDAVGPGNEPTTADGAVPVLFRPRVLRGGGGGVDTSTSVLGVPVRTPVLAAPMALQRAVHPEGEVATGTAVREVGSLLSVSTLSAVRFADVSGCGAPWWFQVYVMKDRSLTAGLVERACDAGARALVLTVDVVALSGAVDPERWPAGDRLQYLNLTPEELARVSAEDLREDPWVDADVIGWLRRLSGLPVLVKGVLRADDALRCTEAGAVGVVVSTHGGRRLGPTVSPFQALPEVVGAVGPDIEVYLDSGIRDGRHVAAALSIGARAVFVGRPVLWGLATAGAAGVARVLRGLTGELETAMERLGATALAELTPDLVAPVPGSARSGGHS